MKRYHTLIVASAGLLCTAMGVFAQPMTAQVSTMASDRWNYPFASSPGNRATVPCYGTGGDVRFDDRDSEFYLAFSTGADVPKGLAPGMYRLIGANVQLQISEDQVFAYDPSQDPFQSYLASTDPNYVADTDTGRPIEIFGVNFRNGFNLFTFGDSSPFKPGSQFAPPWVGVRNAYPVDFGGVGGAARDVSSNVRAGFEASPLGVGVASSLTPGALVPAGTVFVFPLDVTNAGSRSYVQRSLSQGRVALMVTAMQVASEFGSGPVVYPVFYTSKAKNLGFPTAQGPSLTVNVTVCATDYNADGFKNLDDLGDFITDYYTLPAIPGGVQPAAPQYAGEWVGYSTPCPNAPDAPAPYAADAYRTNGYRVGFSPDGSNACPLSPEQTFPNLDNLGDFITQYYSSSDC
jgi:hypothetical protein